MKFKFLFTLTLNHVFRWFSLLQVDDDDVARKISEKLKMAGTQGISFCNIAKKAQELGRKNLAIKVILTISLMLIKNYSFILKLTNPDIPTASRNGIEK